MIWILIIPALVFLIVFITILEYNWAQSHLPKIRIYEFEGEYLLQYKYWFVWKKPDIAGYERIDGEYNMLMKQRGGNSFLTLNAAKAHINIYMKELTKRIKQEKDRKTSSKGTVYTYEHKPKENK